MVEFLVAISAQRFKPRKVAVEESLARPLFPEPKHFKVHFLGVSEHGVVGFVKAWCVKLPDKDRATKMLF